MAGRAFTVMAALVIALSGCTAFDEPAPDPSPSPLRAADGTDLAACRDAACEVEVREDDEMLLDPKWHIHAIKVEYLSEEKITLWLKGMTGRWHVECTETDLTGDDGHVSVKDGRPCIANDLEFAMAPGDSDRAVLTLRHGGG